MSTLAIIEKRKGFEFILIVVFLSPFIIAIGAIYYIGQTNSSKIEAYFAKNECQSVFNYKTKYKALCQNGVILINDHFMIDFSTNENIEYSSIDSIEKDAKKVYIQYAKLGFVLEFEKESDTQTFYKNLQKRVMP